MADKTKTVVIPIPNSISILSSKASKYSRLLANGREYLETLLKGMEE